MIIGSFWRNKIISSEKMSSCAIMESSNPHTHYTNTHPYLRNYTPKIHFCSSFIFFYTIQ